MSTYDILYQHVATLPNKPVTVFEERETRYEEMADRSKKLGNYLRGRGLMAGDAVLFFCQIVIIL